MFQFDFQQTRMLILASVSLAIICWQNDVLFYSFCLTALMVAVAARVGW